MAIKVPRSGIVNAIGIAAIGLGIVVSAEGNAASSAWKPEKAVELIVPSTAGGGTDLTARIIQKIIQEKRLVDVPVAVVNKPGGGGTVALQLLNQYAGDGHYLSTASSLLLTSHITGISPYTHTDFTPVAKLISEYIVFAVKADSPIRTAKDLVAKLRTDTLGAVAIGASLGSPNHISAVTAVRASGGDVKKLRAVVFRSSAESTTALLGGHVELMTSSAAPLASHVKSGAVRLLAISAPVRSSGVLAGVPTWKENGHDIVVDNFRVLLGSRALSPTQTAYWDGVLAKVVEAEEWKNSLEANLWESSYLGPRDAAKYLSSQYDQLRRALGDLGLAK